MMIVYCLVAIVFCVLCSYFFSSSEMSYSSCNKIRLKHAAEDGDKRAGLALQIANKFDDALSTILVGNNLANIAASSLGSIVVIALLGEKYTWISTLVITIVVIVFSETVPKILAQNAPNQTAIKSAHIIRFLMIILKPVTTIVVGIVKLLTHFMKGEAKNEDNSEEIEKLQVIIETAEQEKILDENRSDLMRNAIDFSDISVYEVMTARVDMKALDTDDSWEESLQKIYEYPYSRLPVFEGNADNILGILPLNRFLKMHAENEYVNIQDLLIPACYVYKTMKLPSVLEELRHAQQHMAIVTDEYGGTLGLVSIEDVLEQLVGDIWDETDVVEPDIVEKSQNIYEIDGDTSISDFFELMDWDEDAIDFESDTIGGWSIEMLERFPQPGDSFEYANIAVKVLGIEEHRVTKVLVTVTPIEEE